MKGTPRSIMMSAASRAIGWWIGKSAKTMKQGRKAWVAALAQAAVPDAAARKRPRRRAR